MSTSSSSLTVSLSAPHVTYSASDVVSGVIELIPHTDKTSAFVMTRVTAKLRVQMVTTYRRDSKNAGRNKIDRTESTRLYGAECTLFSSLTAPIDGPLQPNHTYAPLTLPFSFRLPDVMLPPSFQGGSRGKGARKGDCQGDFVAKVLYYVKITGHKEAKLAIAKRILLPFTYMPPPTILPSQVPRLVMSSASSAPTIADLQAQGPTWTTVLTEKEVQGKAFGKKGKIIVSLSLPLLPSLPPGTALPFRLGLRALSSPLPPQAAIPRTVPAPPLSAVSVTLVRSVFTQARGQAQTVEQVVGTVVDAGKGGWRTWRGEEGWCDVDTAGDHRRWGREDVAVGEMMFGAAHHPSGGGTGPSFTTQGTRGLLACSFGR